MTYLLGPYLSQYMLSIISRERPWNSKFSKPRQRECFYSRSEHPIDQNGHERLPDTFDSLVPYLSPPETESILRHPDFRLENIFVIPQVSKTQVLSIGKVHMHYRFSNKPDILNSFLTTGKECHECVS